MSDAPTLLDLEITGLAHDGRGVARTGGGATSRGMAVFVTGALPGQHVRARVLRRKNAFLEATAVETLRAAPDAAPPICPHHAQCGGCPLQTMPYARQLHWKRVLALDALARIGGLDRAALDSLLAPAAPSPALTRYRNKMEFAFGGGAGDALTLGLRRRNGRDVVSVPGCALMPPEAQAIVTATRELAANSGFAAHVPPAERHGGGRAARSHGAALRRRTGEPSGFWRFLILRRGLLGNLRAPRWWALCLTGPASAGQRAYVRGMGRELLAAFPHLAAVIHEERAAADGLACGERRVLTLDAAGRDTPAAALLQLPLGGRLFTLDAASFFQVNTGAAQTLARTAAAMLAPPEGDRRPAALLDLYCGAGAPGLLLASGCAALLGLEQDERAVQLARRNAAALGAPHCRYRAGDAAQLEQLVAAGKNALWDGMPLPPDTRPPRADALLDPPRAGLAPRVLSALQALAPERILYISCNPSTLARDARSLQQTHILTTLAAVDLFPHTPHLECLSLWRRR